MSPYLYLAFIVILGIIPWPLGRWCMEKGGNPALMGFWICITAGAVCGAVLSITGLPTDNHNIILAALIFGFSYSVGFCLLIMHCLKIGPTGPTVTINNMSMIFGVLYGSLWLKPNLPSDSVIIGVIGVCVALVLIGHGVNKGDKSAHSANSTWLKLVLLGGALGGFSFSAQTYIGTLYPSLQALSLFGTCGFFFATLILSKSFLTCGGFRKKRELIAGCVIGIDTGIGLIFILQVLHTLGAAVTLPIAIVTPMVLMLIAGQYLYKEHLSKQTLWGCILGIIALGLIVGGS